MKIHYDNVDDTLEINFSKAMRTFSICANGDPDLRLVVDVNRQEICGIVIENFYGKLKDGKRIDLKSIKKPTIAKSLQNRIDRILSK